MGLFSEVKCGRCDRRYSGLRARCPYCGARRGKRGKHANDNDNSKGRLVIGLILLLVLIVAVVVVIATSVTNAPPPAEDEQQQTEQGGISGSDDITNVEGVGAVTGTEDAGNTGTTVPDEDAATEDETAEEDTSNVETAVNDVYIVSPWSDEPQSDFVASVGDSIDFDFVTDPELEDPDVKWETSDDSVFVILQTGEFTAIGEGVATLKLTVNGVSVEIDAHVR